MYKIKGKKIKDTKSKVQIKGKKSKVKNQMYKIKGVHSF